MSSVTIIGSHKLSGTISVSGNKNSILPIMASCLISKNSITLTNVPKISDVEVMIKILTDLGVSVSRPRPDKLVLQANNVKKKSPNYDLVTKLRASILVLPGILARKNEASINHPGGCVIGKRSIDVHIQAFKELGAKVDIEPDKYTFSLSKKSPTNKYVYLDEASVTATENVLIYCAVKKSPTTIYNAACEPHVVELCQVLIAMGVKISGVGSNRLTVTGTDSFKPVVHQIKGDPIEAGSYLIAASALNSQITVKGVSAEDILPLLKLFSKLNQKFKSTRDQITVYPSKLTSVEKIVTGPWPAFPTDLISPIIVLLTQVHTTTLVHDWMYESRMVFVDKLKNMGADITVTDPHRVIVRGPTALSARKLDSPDIRAGMALIIASLIAKKKSKISNISLIERGYDSFVQKFSSLGAKINYT